MTVTGLDKFSHLEDKIYRTAELCNRLRQEKEQMEREMSGLRGDVSRLLDERERNESQIKRLVADRDALRLKVEAMLDAIAVLELETEMKR